MRRGAARIPALTVAAILEWDAKRRVLGNQKALARRLGVEAATVRYVLERAREASSL